MGKKARKQQQKQQMKQKQQHNSTPRRSSTREKKRSLRGLENEEYEKRWDDLLNSVDDIAAEPESKDATVVGSATEPVLESKDADVADSTEGNAPVDLRSISKDVVDTVAGEKSVSRGSGTADVNSVLKDPGVAAVDKPVSKESGSVVDPENELPCYDDDPIIHETYRTPTMNRINMTKSHDLSLQDEFIDDDPIIHETYRTPTMNRINMTMSHDLSLRDELIEAVESAGLPITISREGGTFLNHTQEIESHDDEEPDYGLQTINHICDMYDDKTQKFEGDIFNLLHKNHCHVAFVDHKPSEKEEPSQENTQTHRLKSHQSAIEKEINDRLRSVNVQLSAQLFEHKKQLTAANDRISALKREKRFNEDEVEEMLNERIGRERVKYLESIRDLKLELGKTSGEVETVGVLLVQKQNEMCELIRKHKEEVEENRKKLRGVETEVGKKEKEIEKLLDLNEKECERARTFEKVLDDANRECGRLRTDNVQLKNQRKVDRMNDEPDEFQTNTTVTLVTLTDAITLINDRLNKHEQLMKKHQQSHPQHDVQMLQQLALLQPTLLPQPKQQMSQQQLISQKQSLQSQPTSQQHKAQLQQPPQQQQTPPQQPPRQQKAQLQQPPQQQQALPQQPPQQQAPQQKPPQQQAPLQAPLQLPQQDPPQQQQVNQQPIIQQHPQQTAAQKIPAIYHTSPPIQQQRSSQLQFFNNALSSPPPTDTTKLVPGNRNYNEVVKQGREICIYSTSITKGIKKKDINDLYVGEGTISFRRFHGAIARDVKKYIGVHMEEESPASVIIQTGGNDLPTPRSNPLPVSEIAVEIIKSGLLCQRAGVENIYVGGVLLRRPYYTQARCRELNDILREECKKHGFIFIDNSNINMGHVQDDGVHLTHEGSEILRDNYSFYLNSTAWSEMFESQS